jgi:hypothetical protein
LLCENEIHYYRHNYISKNETRKDDDKIIQLDVASATVLAAGIGAIVAGGVSAVNTWLIHRSEERRQIRELAVRAAIEEWTKHMEIGEKCSIETQPLDLYLIHAMYFIKALDGSLRTKEEIRDHLRNVHTMTDAAGQEIKNYSKTK